MGYTYEIIATEDWTSWNDHIRPGQVLYGLPVIVDPEPGELVYATRREAEDAANACLLDLARGGSRAQAKACETANIVIKEV